jgi:DNA-binding transcriptional MerR regulator
MKRIEKERGNRYVGLPEFALVSARIVSELDLEQLRGTVTSVPDERTIRYYLSEGLIQPPEEKQGTASVFEYQHLLQLVAVKKLQAEHLPIRKIRELVAGKNERELEMLLGIRQPSRQTEAKRYLESLLVHPAVPASPPRASATLGMEAMLSASAPRQADVSWQRVEIEPGLELHIRADYSPPTSSLKRRGLVDRIRRVLEKWRTSSSNQSPD